MLVMHYKIALADAAAVATIRTRATERGPLFDSMAGLAHKLFLVDPVDPCYATYYLWQDPAAALGFLEGPFFAALTQTFGRPEVELLLTQSTDLPFSAGETIVLDRLATTTDGAGSVRAIDPKNGEILSMGQGGQGRRFEVMYHAVGATA
jgi:hypothetical protein